MNTYQITLEGFDARTSDTDHLVLWINSPSVTVLHRYLQQEHIPYTGCIDLLDHLDINDTAIDLSILSKEITQ